MSSMPENINYGDPNSYPTNFPLDARQEQYKSEQISSQIKINEQQLTEQSANSNGSKKNEKKTDEVMEFLNIKATTILTFATAVAIGLALKDFMGALVVNILQPSIIMLITTLDKNEYLPITTALKERNAQIDFTKFFGASLVLKLVVVSMYFIYKYSTVLF